VPGTYDIHYRRGWTFSTNSGDRWVNLTDDQSPYPNADRLLRENVVIAAGSNTLDVDIPTARVTGDITLGGAGLPASVASKYNWEATLYAVARDTGLRHTLGQIRYGYSSGVYALVAGDDTYEVTLVPGVYDIHYRRGWTFGTSSGDRWVNLTDDQSPYPNADRLLSSCVALQ